MIWLPKILSFLMLWGVVGYIVFVIPPSEIRDIFIEGLYLPFFGTLFIATYYSAALVIRNSMTALVVSLLVILFIVLSALNLLNIFSGTATIALIVYIMFMDRDRSQSRKITQVDLDE